MAPNEGGLIALQATLRVPLGGGCSWATAAFGQHGLAERAPQFAVPEAGRPRPAPPFTPPDLGWGHSWGHRFAIVLPSSTPRRAMAMKVAAQARDTSRKEVARNSGGRP